MRLSERMARAYCHRFAVCATARMREPTVQAAWLSVCSCTAFAWPSYTARWLGYGRKCRSSCKHGIDERANKEETAQTLAVVAAPALVV